MIDARSRRALADAVGEDGLEEHPAVELDGAGLALTLRPGDGEALARGLAALGEAGLSAVVRGSGSGLGLGNPQRGASLFLSLERLAGVDELDEVEGVCHASAGTPLAALREKLASSAWELPLDADGTLGGCLASARIGPRALGFGLPRDVVLGLEVTLGSGERTRCGGRVVKNVTGYDLAKLYVGSFGSLGVIEGAWLRLRPRPESVRTLDVPATDVAGACEVGLAAARRATARAALATRDARGARLRVELAGDARSVARDAAELAEAHDAEETAEGLAQEGSAHRDDALHFRVSARASRIADASRVLGEADATLAIHPGLGLIDARLAVGDDQGAAGWRVALAAAAAGGGSARLEAGPLSVRRQRDIFAGDPALLALHRALKQRFDPGGVLNPGRFMGRS